MESLGFSVYNIISSVDNDSFTFFFPIWMSFISSSYKIAVARTSSTMFKSDRNRHLCLIPDLKGNPLIFCPLSVKLAIDFSYIAFIMLKYDPSIPTLLRVFIIKECFISSNVLLYLLLYLCHFSLSFLNDVQHLLICKYCTELTSLERNPT